MPVHLVEQLPGLVGSRRCEVRGSGRHGPLTADGNLVDRGRPARHDGPTVYQKADKKRPTMFDTPTERGTTLYVFKRAKP
jgi:hypothetical protein